MEVENKVYLVSTQSGSWDDFNYTIISVCKDLETAEKEKQRIEEKIQNIKTLYFLEFDSLYDEDLELLNDDDFIENSRTKYNNVVHNIYNFQAKHPELKIHTVNIEERELL